MAKQGRPNGALVAAGHRRPNRAPVTAGQGQPSGAAAVTAACACAEKIAQRLRAAE